MVAIPIKFFVVIVVAVACCHCQSEKIGSDSSTCAEKLQISPDTFSSVEYANFLIEIYEYTDNNKATTTMSQKKYFYSPLAILDHKSAVSSYNNVTNQSEMRFRIEMWNDKVQNEVVKHLKKIVGQEIKSNQVRIIPTKKIILTSDVPTAEYSISSPWTN
jgi:ribosomal protein S8